MSQNIKGIKEIWNKYQYILTRAQKRWGIILLIMTVIGALVETLGVSIILPLVQVMIDPVQLQGNNIFQYLMKVFNLTTNVELTWFIGIVVVLVYLIKNVYLLILSYVRVRYSCKVQRELSVELMESYMKQGYLFFTNVTVGELLRGMQGSIESVYDGIYHAFRIFAEIFTVFCVCVYILFTDWKMALCVALLAGVCLVLIVVSFKKWARKSGEVIHKYNAQTNKTLLRAFYGIKEVLVMQRQQYFVDSYEEQYSKRQNGMISKTVLKDSPTYVIEGICVVGLIIAVCFKAINAEDTTVLVPQLAAFAVAAFRLLPSLGRISSYFNAFLVCLPGVNEVYSIFQNVRKYENKKAEVVSREKIGRKIEWNEIDVKDIVWSYPNSSQVVLDKVSLKIRKGESIALVGASGAGKSTLGDILLGLLKPLEGNVYIDNVELNEVIKNHSGMIGFVPQNVYLLDDSIRKNIAFGIDEKNINEKKLWKAIAQASLNDFVKDLPEGLETMVGESGVKLSGGQRQRIAIARALYSEPDILVLDEATSALDNETETAVMESIKTLHGKKTLIIIAHRLTTIRDCDRIYKIENGKAEIKKYEEL